MDQPTHYPGAESARFFERFDKFIEGFTRIGAHNKLFPKKCHTCGRVFRSFPEYVHLTYPVKHAMEDCKAVMKKPYTMQYQNCLCGTTLILVLTEETYPELDDLWEALREEAERVDLPLKVIVAHFYEKCTEYIVKRYIPVDKEPELEDEGPAATSPAESVAEPSSAGGVLRPVAGLVRGLGSLFGRKKPPPAR
jgi:hypothetical protein